MLTWQEILVLGIIVGTGILSTLIWAVILIDCLVNEPVGGNERLVWAIVIALTHLIGALVYLFWRRPQRLARTVNER